LATGLPTSTAALTSPATINSIKVKTAFSGFDRGGVDDPEREARDADVGQRRGAVRVRRRPDRHDQRADRREPEVRRPQPERPAQVNNQLSDIALTDATFLVL
jgi:hypothetical protein